MLYVVYTLLEEYLPRSIRCGNMIASIVANAYYHSAHRSYADANI